MSDLDKDKVYSEFYDAVNMEPKELEEWLDTDESKSVGDSDSGESTGHRSGRRIVEIKRTNKDDLSESDLEHMNKVVNYIKRHTGQRREHPAQVVLGSTGTGGHPGCVHGCGRVGPEQVLDLVDDEVQDGDHGGPSFRP